MPPHLMSYAGVGKTDVIRVSHSAEAILTLLRQRGTPLAVREIKEELPYSERTIHYALRQLRQHELIEKRANLQDLRESLYLLATRAAVYGYMR
jgi:DNA-binding MarR family transcriptional regulator